MIVEISNIVGIKKVLGSTTNIIWEKLSNELAINILTPTEGQTVTLPSKTTFRIDGATDIIIVQPIEGETVSLPSKTKFKIE